MFEAGALWQSFALHSLVQVPMSGGFLANVNACQVINLHPVKNHSTPT